MQEALILAEPGDEIVLAAGRYALTDGLSLDVDNVTVRGAGMDGTVLDFTGQQGAGEGLLVTSDNVTLRDFALENPKGDGIKSKGADNIVYHRIRVTWTRGPHAENGAYGVYPVESTGVLVDRREGRARRMRASMSASRKRSPCAIRWRGQCRRDRDREQSRRAGRATMSPPATPAASWSSTCPACR